jgi:hypothetical protein
VVFIIKSPIICLDTKLCQSWPNSPPEGIEVKENINIATALKNKTVHIFFTTGDMVMFTCIKVPYFLKQLKQNIPAYHSL